MAFGSELLFAIERRRRQCPATSIAHPTANLPAEECELLHLSATPPPPSFVLPSKLVAWSTEESVTVRRTEEEEEGRGRRGADQSVAV